MSLWNENSLMDHFIWFAWIAPCRSFVDYRLVSINRVRIYRYWNVVKIGERKCLTFDESLKWTGLACCLDNGLPSKHSWSKFFLILFLVFNFFFNPRSYTEFKAVHQESSWMDTHNRLGMEVCWNWIFRKKLGKRQADHGLICPKLGGIPGSRLGTSITTAYSNFCFGFFCRPVVDVYSESNLFLSSQLLFFPEGTRYTPEKHAVSMEFAAKTGLPHLKHLLIPRTKGFFAITQQLRNHFDAVYSGTLCFNT